MPCYLHRWVGYYLLKARLKYLPLRLESSSTISQDISRHLMKFFTPTYVTIHENLVAISLLMVSIALFIWLCMAMISYTTPVHTTTSYQHIAHISPDKLPRNKFFVSNLNLTNVFLSWGNLFYSWPSWFKNKWLLHYKYVHIAWCKLSEDASRKNLQNSMKYFL